MRSIRTVKRDVPKAEKQAQDITKHEWNVILSHLGASDEEIKDVQKRMGRVWR